jgi:hypothetical protein
MVAGINENSRLDEEEKERLDELLSRFNEKFEEEGNRYLYGIQDGGEVKERIGGGNLRRALLVLIASILEYHEDTVIEMASESLKRISMESNKWVLASAIGSKIWVGHNNLEDLETLLNTSGMGLVDEIHEVSMGFHSC